jgi:hypothetical protein
MVAED